ncbi:MAG TPA: EscN/YscN/HrcN family type III secretion system ATPase, partial [Gaiellaceae bacterium]|nr:EscN/YscN/HrcN family type III secretion system ATPase [Gaiellaceae bacterium]
GSITGLYTVLVDGDDMTDPVADAVRSILDGHCVLSRELAHRNHYPAVDVLQSVSRLTGEVTTPEHRAAAAAVRELLAVHREKSDLISIGAYAPGSDERVDRAIELMPAIEGFLRQPIDEQVPAGVSDGLLVELAAS